MNINIPFTFCMNLLKYCMLIALYVMERERNDYEKR